MKSKATASVILSGLLWGIITIFIKHLSACGLDSLQISAIRMTISAVAFSLFLLIVQPSAFQIRLRDIWMFVCTGIVSVVLFNTLYFYTMIQSEASIAVVLLYTSPIFVMVMSAVFFGEKITGIKAAALVLTFIGCIMVSGVLGFGYKMTLPLILTGVGSGLFYASYSIFGRVALEKYDTMTVTLYTFIFGMIGSVPMGKVGQTIQVIKRDPGVMLWMLGIGIMSTVLPYLFYTWGLKRMDPGKAGILVAVEPVVGAVLGMLVYNESTGVLKTVGIVLVIAAIILLNLKSAGSE